MGSTFIHDVWSGSLRPDLATCGYIHVLSKLGIEKKNLQKSVPGVNSLNLSFDPDPYPDAHLATPYIFPTMGDDIVITSSPKRAITANPTDSH